MPLFSDLTEVKKILEVDPANTVEDAKLLIFQDWAAGTIERCINRRDLFVKARTEFYSGSGTQKILLRGRPAYTTPTPRVWVMENDAGNFGSVDTDWDDNELTYGTDFCLDTPDNDGVSRSGILLRPKGWWPRPAVRAAGLLSPYLGESYGNVKVQYTAGYTVNDLPPDFRLAAVLLLTNLRWIFPVGVPLSGDSYEGQSVNLTTERKDYLLALAKPILWHYRNWRFG